MVDDETLFKVMQTAHETGGLVMVHAENGDAIDIIVKEAVAEGKTDPIWHARTRPMETEAEATNRAIQLAHVADAPLYVVHVSCQPAVEPIALAREKGWKVWGETCTQYLFVDESMLEKPDWEGAKYIYTPPAAPEGAPGAPLEGARLGRALGALDRPLPLQLARAEGDQRPRVPGRPERRPGDREPAPHALDARREHGADHAEPVRRARLDEHREAVRPLPAQGDDRAGLRRGHRGLGPGEEADDLREDPPHERQLQPLRGRGGHRSARGRPRARPGHRRERRAGRRARRGSVREARALRRGADSGYPATAA